MHKKGYWESIEALYEVSSPPKLTYDSLMEYCNNIMHDMGCEFFEALIYFIEDNSEYYDEFDVIEVLSDLDKKILKESLSIKFNIGREENIVVF